MHGSAKGRPLRQRVQVPAKDPDHARSLVRSSRWSLSWPSTTLTVTSYSTPRSDTEARVDDPLWPDIASLLRTRLGASSEDLAYQLRNLLFLTSTVLTLSR